MTKENARIQVAKQVDGSSYMYIVSSCVCTAPSVSQSANLIQFGLLSVDDCFAMYHESTQGCVCNTYRWSELQHVGVDCHWIHHLFGTVCYADDVHFLLLQLQVFPRLNKFTHSTVDSVSFLIQPVSPLAGTWTYIQPWSIR